VVENADATDGPGCHSAYPGDGCWCCCVGVGTGALAPDCQGCPGAHDESVCHDGEAAGWLGGSGTDDGGGGGIGDDERPGRAGTAGAAAAGRAS